MVRTAVNPTWSRIDRSEGLHALFRGVEGLEVFVEGAAVSAPLPERFVAESFTTDYSGVQVGRLRCGACSFRRAAPPPGLGDGFELTLVLEGSLRIQQGEATGGGERGDLLVTRSSEEQAFDATEPFHVAWLFVPEDRVPPRLLAPDALPRGPLPETRLSASFGAFLRRLAAGPAVGQGPDRIYLARAVAELAVAVVAESIGDAEPEDRAAALRTKVREHVERHLGDHDLGPQQIAAALGVSVRYVHRVFNTEGDTVAKYIRERRLEAVARLLRTERRPQRVGALAERFGFSGRDHLTRAFRQRYGTTLREYQDAAALEADEVLSSTRLPD